MVSSYPLQNWQPYISKECGLARTIHLPIRCERRSISKSAAVKWALHRRTLSKSAGWSTRLPIRLIQAARSLSSFGRRCKVMPGVPWWLEQPGAKHPGIVFDQNLKFILYDVCYRQLLDIMNINFSTNDVIGTEVCQVVCFVPIPNDV